MWNVLFDKNSDSSFECCFVVPVKLLVPDGKFYVTFRHVNAMIHEKYLHFLSLVLNASSVPEGNVDCCLSHRARLRFR